MSSIRARRAHLILALFAASFVASCFLLAGALAVDGAAAQRGKEIRVMVRNLYLGADLTDAVNAGSASEFVEANGAILRSVDSTDFRKRSRGLAREILRKRPDLVGLQEVALWRTAPGSLAPVLSGEPSATTVAYDFLKLLMKRLNTGAKRYRVVVVQKEFDFEAPADKNQQPNDGPPLAEDGEINGRLTMRDVILARVGAGVKTTNAKGGQFETQYEVTIAGAVPVTVERGFVRTNATVRGSKPFRFVNTHLEAFGDPNIREAQAKELVANGGPATGRLPVILVGDLNSDDNTVQGADRKAYLAVKRAGFVDRAAGTPMTCCIQNPLLTGRSAADFVQRIDHILTDAPRRITRVRSSVTGRSRFLGLWPSDHAGVFSVLRLR